MCVCRLEIPSVSNAEKRTSHLLWDVSLCSGFVVCVVFLDLRELMTAAGFYDCTRVPLVDQ